MKQNDFDFPDQRREIQRKKVQKKVIPLNH